VAGISAEDFASKIRQVCDESVLVVRVAVIAQSKHQAKLRIFLRDRSVIAVYYNSENGKTGFAQYLDNLRIFGADNANRKWHWHLREDPSQHVSSDHEITFEEFMARLEPDLK